MRNIKSAGNLSAAVEGSIEEVEGVLRITRIHLRYRLQIPRGSRKKIEELLDRHAGQCPAYQSVRGAIEVTWDAELAEAS